MSSNNPSQPHIINSSQPHKNGELGELGKASSYITTYSPGLLFPIERAPTRLRMGIKATPSFLGADLWTAYELSWLNMRGKPEVCIARLIVPCESTHIVESKSLKLYLNSFNSTRFESKEIVKNDTDRQIFEIMSKENSMPFDIFI